MLRITTEDRMFPTNLVAPTILNFAYSFDRLTNRKKIEAPEKKANLRIKMPKKGNIRIFAAVLRKYSKFIC